VQCLSLSLSPSLGLWRKFILSRAFTHAPYRVRACTRTGIRAYVHTCTGCKLQAHVRVGGDYDRDLSDQSVGERRICFKSAIKPHLLRFNDAKSVNYIIPLPSHACLTFSFTYSHAYAMRLTLHISTSMQLRDRKCGRISFKRIGFRARMRKRAFYATKDPIAEWCLANSRFASLF